MEKPFAGKATVTDTYDGMEMSIPSRKQWIVIVFLFIWLCGWICGLVMVVKFSGVVTQPTGVTAFTWVWLVGWTFSGLFALRMLIWNVFGKEIVTFRRGEVTIERKKLVLSSPKTYNLSEAKDFRIGQLPVSGLDEFGNERQNLQLSTNIGYIWFDYGMKIIRFGAGIDEAEAKYLLQRIKDKRIIGEKTTTYQTHL